MVLLCLCMASGNRIIGDARVLTADYLPNKLVHREGERQEIARNLRPILDGEWPNDMLLYGPPGTGKTAMARYVVEELKKEKFVQSSYVNCFSQKSRFEIFYELLDEKVTTPRDSTSTEKVIDKFEEKVRNEPTVLIIDELDQIKDDDIIYELSRFKKTAIIYIANDQNVFSHFEGRVRSRITGLKNIRFKSYSTDELTDILELRKKHGLREGSVQASQLRSLASNADGDARMALNSLRFAAREGENRGKEKITDSIISEAISTASKEEQLKSSESLNKHQKAVYKAIEEEGEMSMGDLYESYRTRVDDPRTKRTLRRYMNKMEAYNVIESSGEKSGKTYSLS